MSLDFNDKTRSIRAQWAHQHVTNFIRTRINNPPPLSGHLQGSWPAPVGDREELPPAPTMKPSDGDFPITNPHIAIVGGGAAGLFTAMIIDYLNENTPSPGFNCTYDIYEASNPPKELNNTGVGGRLFTYEFMDNGSSDCRHKYFDVGAMRFPDSVSNPIMQRVFDLFFILGMQRQDFSSSAPIGSLVPYQMENSVTVGSTTVQQEYWCYNNVTKWGSYVDITTADVNQNPFDLNKGGPTGVPPSLFTQDPSLVFNSGISYFRNALKNAQTAKEAWDTLMSYDQFTTREALMSPPPLLPGQTGAVTGGLKYNYETVQWMETFNGGTGWYDQALSESVLESLDFEYNDPPVENTWRCILGGAQQLALNMGGYLKGKQPTMNSRVTAIRAPDPLHMQIDVNGALVGTSYNAVFNSTTLGCFGRIDTTDTNLKLNYSLREATRTLAYGPSAKVGILFKKAWWMFDLGVDGNNNYNIASGGLGHSDLNLRTVVYPSYNADLTENDHAVLLCSYTWQQDALRMGSLMSSNAIPAVAAAEEDLNGLKTLLIRELAQLHANPVMSATALEQVISDNWLDHYSHDWTRDPNCAGAFAFFGAGQFSGLWGGMIQPNSNLVVIGEHASPHHAWVVGALESAVYGVYSWLKLRADDVQGASQAADVLAGKAVQNNPFVGLPPYMDANTAQWAAIFAKLDEEKHFAERGGNEAL